MTSQFVLHRVVELVSDEKTDTTTYDKNKVKEILPVCSIDEEDGATRLKILGSFEKTATLCHLYKRPT